ncbi:helix-turn-helix transcriptional regulator [Bradyrhizobium sp. SRL28]|uniref:helix-turn-helix domain-containing protein n=1 Tax=Bradyrhizobium sp. SRL28 TaxID=2836178 RepID=UPI001BDEF605|nr:AraC family transcriptional regulator [Bradyrhizobium sp. SRL28]MBT1513531.1 helix-turn-helix transcriptional regulator [Bradyrhizobium sp. SRL28]
MGAPSFSPLCSIPSTSGAAARLACAKLLAAGIPLAPLLSRAGLKAEQIDDPVARIEVKAQVQLLDIAAEQLKDDLFGFRMATDFELRKIGLPYYIFSTSNTLADALSDAERYTRLANDGIQLRISLDRAIAIALDCVGVELGSSPHQMEFWLFAVVRICRQLTETRLAPLQLKVRHRRGAPPPEFRTFLGCDVEFASDANEIIFPKSVSSLPISGADCYLHELLVRYAEDTLADQAPAKASVRSRAEKAIAPLLPHGKASVATIARELGMSRRTLARALAAEGLTFSALLDQYRVNLAKAYLTHGDLAISQIAWLLGYREVSAFTHAFKRWTGITPRQSRAGAHSG